MIIKGTDIGKKFGKTWIFRHLAIEIHSGTPVAIAGKNGAGKSTLLQILSGYLTPSAGDILVDDIKMDEQTHAFTHIGPYTEVIEEFTLKEFLSFHQQFKKPTCTIEEMAASASLPLDKVIGDFSTGMKQRAKLITAFFFENDALFLDEPTSNLDEEGFQWWKNQLQAIKSQIVVIASNDQAEISQCTDHINL